MFALERNRVQDNISVDVYRTQITTHYFHTFMCNEVILCQVVIMGNLLSKDLLKVQKSI